MTSPKLMTADAIRRRLAEIAEQQDAHDRRNMDAELRDVMLNGGDVDAMEASQLEAERASRRLRVERSALESELPHASRRQGETIISDLHNRHQSLTADARERASALVAAWASFSSALAAWEAVQEAAKEITLQASVVAKQSLADMPRMGTFRSEKVAALGRAAFGIDNRFSSAAGEMQVEFGVQSTVID